MATTIRHYLPGDEDFVTEIMQLALAAGELAGTTPGDVERIRDRLPIDPQNRIMSLEDGRIAGFIIPTFQLLAVHPARRRRGHGRRLVERALELARERGEAELELAVPLGDVAAESFARALGFHYRSSLYLLGLAPGDSVPSPAFAPDLRLDPIRVGVDEEALLELFRASFADHPSPIPVSLDGMRHVHSLPGFDPNELVLLRHADDPAPIAFCRIGMDEHDGRTDGEVDLIGVLPHWRGQGLGRELLRWGVHTLRERGAGRILLSVEARNERALSLYRRHSFTQAQEWPRWARETSPPSPLSCEERGS
jgi:mycothiol synthase